MVLFVPKTLVMNIPVIGIMIRREDIMDVDHGPRRKLGIDLFKLKNDVVAEFIHMA